MAIRQRRPAPNPVPRALRWKGKQIRYQGMTLSGAEWAARFGLKRGTFYRRRRVGWSMDRIRKIPVVPNGRWMGERAPFTRWTECVPRRVKPGAKCHPVVRAIYDAMCDERCTYAMMAARSGVSTSAIMAMRRNGPGYFANVEAMAMVVGLSIGAMTKGGRALRGKDAGAI